MNRNMDVCSNVVPEVSPDNYYLCSIPELFDATVNKVPDKVAVVSGVGGEKETTFIELSEQVGRIRNVLASYGLDKGSHVGIHCEKGSLLIASILALWDMGLVYVPLETSYPREYLEKIADLADLKLIIGENSNDLNANCPRLKDTDIEQTAPEKQPTYRSQNLNGPALLMYTSGSTGVPKGVLHSQRQVLNRLAWMWSRFPARQEDVASVRSMISVMPSMWELFGGLLLGLTTVMIPPDVVQKPSQFLSLIRGKKISWLTITPSILRLLLNALERTDRSDIRSLRMVTIGGEPLTDKIISRFRRQFPDALLVEDYGATEVNTIGYGLREPGEVHKFYPIANISVEVRGEDFSLLDNGEEGEICVAGDSLALGYYKARELSANLFKNIDDSRLPLHRIYKTKDIGKKLDDGSFVLIGRLGSRVKINSQTVELSGIEAVFRDYQEVRDAVVVYRKNGNNHDHLTAWVALEPGGSLTAADLKTRMQGQLPRFMIPHRIKIVDALPRLPNGKPDRVKISQWEDDQDSGDLSPDGPFEQKKALDEASCVSVIARVAEAILSRKLDEADYKKDWNHLGFDSITLVDFCESINVETGASLSISDCFNHPDIQALGRLLSGIESVDRRETTAKDSSCAEQSGVSDREQVDNHVAVIGMAGSFPGAGSVASLWEMIKNGESSIEEIPEERWALQGFYSADKAQYDHSYSKWGGFLESVYDFDEARYGLTPNEAMYLDPQQRLCYQMVRAVIQDAGYSRGDLSGKRVGVFVGARQSGYASVLEKAGMHLGSSPFLGVDNALLAGRISYSLGVHGPSLVIDTACSSSMVALHLASQSIQSGECDIAVVGGVSVTLDPEFYIQTSALNVFSPTGVCRPFDDTADGFVHGEGVCFVMLRSVAGAVENKDHIYGVIEGTGVNHDGYSNSVTSPNGESQKALITTVLEASNTSVADIAYVEAHGTGTRLGDPIEADALGEVFSAQERKEPCCIGSLKANIGHLTAAAGMASLIKGLLCVYHGVRPPMRNFKKLNTHIKAAFSRTFRVPVVAETWQEGSRRALISSFGLSGTNGACIVKSWNRDRHQESNGSAGDLGNFKIVVSANNLESLKHYITDLYHDISNCDNPLSSIAFTLCSRDIEATGWYFETSSRQDLLSKLFRLMEARPPKPAGIFRADTSLKDSPAVVSAIEASELSGLKTQFESTVARRIKLPVSKEYGRPYRPAVDMSIQAVRPPDESKPASESIKVHDAESTDRALLLAEICSDMLGPRNWTEVENTLFAELGMDSLKALSLKERINDVFKVKVDVVDLLSEMSFHGLRVACENTVVSPGAEKEKQAIDGRVLKTGPVTSDAFALTDLQSSNLLAKMTASGVDAIGALVFVTFKVSRYDHEKLENTWNRLVANNAMLRARILKTGRQIIESVGHRISIKKLDATVAAYDSRDKEYTELRRLRTKLFRPDEYPLYEISAIDHGNGEALVAMIMDASIIDAHSANILFSQWYRLYYDESFTLQSPAMEFRDFVDFAKAGRNSEKYSAAKAYWAHKLDREWDGASLPFSASEEVGGSWFRVSRTLAEKDTDELFRHFNSIRVTTTSGLLAVFTDWLSRYQNGHAYALILTLKNRPGVHPDIENVVGPFTSTSVFLGSNRGKEKFGEHAERIQKQLFDDMEHHGISGVEALRAQNNSKPIPIVYSALSKTVDEEKSWFNSVESQLAMTTGVKLHCHVTEMNGNVEIAWDVDGRYMPREYAETLLDELLTCFKKMNLEVSSTSVAGKNFQSTGSVYYAPLTSLMQTYCIQDLMSKNSQPSYVVRTYEMPGATVTSVAKALHALNERHGIMSSVINLKGMTEWIACHADFPVYQMEWDGPEPESLKDACMQVEARMTSEYAWMVHRGFGFVTTVMSYRGKRYVTLLFKCLYFDGVSTLTLPAELDQLLQSGGTASKMPIVDRQAAFNYANKRAALSYTSVGRSANEYWKSRLEGIFRKDDSRLSISKGSVKSTLHADIGSLERFMAVSDRMAVGVDAILIHIYQKIISSIAAYRNAHILVVEYLHRRLKDAWNHGVGDFSTFCIVSSYKEREDTVLGVQEVLEKDRAHSFGNIFSNLPTQIRQDESLFPFVFTNGLIADAELSKFERNCVYFNSNTRGVFIDCFLYRKGDVLSIEWTFTDGGELKDEIPYLFSQYVDALKSFVGEQEKNRLGNNGADNALSLHDLSPLELLAELNRTEAKYSRNATLVSVFDDAAARYADRIAVIDDRESFSYRQLHSMSCIYAHYLERKANIGAGDIVALKIQRSGELIALMYAVMRLGGAFIPLNDNDSAARQEKMLSTAQARCLVVDGKSADEFNLDKVRILPFEDFPAVKASDEEFAGNINKCKANDLAYVIFTSGSTGEPKGVMVRHRPVINLIEWAKKVYRFDESDRALWVSSVGFDLSIFDIFGFTAYGASIRVVSNEMRKDALVIRDLLFKEDITFWNSAPVYLQMVLPFVLNSKIKERLKLRLIFLSGDWIPMSLAKDVVDELGNTRLVSLGGATEATVWSNFFDVKYIDPGWKSIPYGKPIQNARYYILDELRRPCEIGRKGRLFIGGECLSDGYINNQAITEKAFVDDEFLPDGKKGIMYDTGDLARYMDDGNIEFLGRADTQVKIRGYRVELSEIAHVMKEVGYVDPIVLVENRKGSQVLLGFCLRPRLPEGKYSEVHMEELKNRLPDYMVPAKVRMLEKYPLTENGKVDRKKLISMNEKTGEKA